MSSKSGPFSEPSENELESGPFSDLGPADCAKRLQQETSVACNLAHFAVEQLLETKFPIQMVVGRAGCL